MGEVLKFPIEQQVKPQAKPQKNKHKGKSKPKRRQVDEFNIFGHLVIGTAISLFLANSPGEAALILFGSLLPDIDHRNSTLGKWNPFTRFMKHRGKCHTLIGCILLSAPFYFFGSILVPILILTGCVGHVLADKLASWLPGRRRFKLRIW
jgi:hypothetical protein